MGLDCSHDAWHGAYSAFNRFRQKIAEAMGGSYPPHKDVSLAERDWYWGEGYSAGTHPGLMVLLSHSDCDGEISPEDCIKVANDLEALLPQIAELDDGDVTGGASFTRKGDDIEVNRHPGHIARAGGYVAVTEKFISGCRAANAADEALEFH